MLNFGGLGCTECIPDAILKELKGKGTERQPSPASQPRPAREDPRNWRARLKGTMGRPTGRKGETSRNPFIDQAKQLTSHAHRADRIRSSRRDANDESGERKNYR